jgi:hypothetical protein
MSVAIPQFMKKVTIFWSSALTNFSYEPPLLAVSLLRDII